MPTEDKFKQSVITTLAKRAASICSNPSCGAITSGPSDLPEASVNVGEAAHIFGAQHGSARYSPEMSSAERSAISNGIWLCSNCHKLIDNDPQKYPPGLLFEWQRDHERSISERVGKAASEARRRYENRHLEEFGRLSYLSERLILEKGDYWEYLLTAEVLRHEMAPVVQRWNALKRGLYVKPAVRIERGQFFSWASAHMGEIGLIVHAFEELTNTELKRSWGEPGVAGNDLDIVTTCRLYAEVCKSTLAWEESVRFVSMDDVFMEIRDLLVGIAGEIIEKAERIPTFISETIAERPTSGRYELVLTIGLPDGWTSAVSAALKRVAKALK